MKSSDPIGPNFESSGRPQSGPKYKVALSVGWSESSGSAKFHCKVSFRISTKETGCGMYLIVRQPSNPNLVVTAKKDGVSQLNHQITRLPRAARPLPMKLVTVGKDRGVSLQSVSVEYIKKIQRYCTFEEIQLRPNPKKSSDVSTQVFSEGKQVLRSISSKDWVVLLDERGKELTSEKFADLIADAGDTGASAVVFCIGGPYGHGPQVHERANVKVKLSTMVLNHQVAFLVLLEQIYRAWTILRGEKYHH